ncbi:Protein Aster-A [Haplosporangium sp. Z 11]|nr:Protein Aster-A [Haplosporangium sp. Z 11]
MELIVRNRELHLRFHGTRVHSKEYVIHSWACGYLDDSRPNKPIMVYGRVFLTQSGMYFYARGMSMETKRMYRFSSIRGIECEQKDISTEWRIETVDGVQHIFCQFTLSDTEYQVLHLIWTNVHQAKDRLPVKEIFRRAMLITNKPKGTAGSGSLAETESNHLTARDGTMSHNGDFVAESSCDVGSEDASINANDEDWADHDDSFPSTLEEPSGPVSCNCPGHLEKVELEQTFKISAKTLNRLLFGADSPIWKEFHERRSNTIQSVGEWSETGGHKSRTVKFLMVVNNPLVKLNHTDCVETHVCEVEEEYLRYSYTVKSSVLAMPYSDAFTPVLRYCITFVNKDECKLTCSSGIEWHKNPLVKAMIKGAIIKGTAETVRDLTEIIQLHLKHHKEHASSTADAGNDSTAGIHTRSDSANIMISLNGPESGSHRILLDPQNQGNNSAIVGNKLKDGRTPGARRHTVSVGSKPSGPIYPGARVQGSWPTGAPPSFASIGSKASRTKLLGRPSRSMLIEQGTSSDGKSNNVDGQGSAHGAEWVKKNLLNLFHAKDEKERQRITTGFVYLVLIVSSLVNIWAAFNSQRMLDATWRMKKHEVVSSGWGRLQGYPEPLGRVFDWRHSGSSGSPDDGARNVRVAARAVFLKDVEEQMLSGELEGFDDERAIDKKSFEIFMEVRDSFRSWPQPLEWFSSDQNASQSSHSGAPTSTSLERTSPTPPTCSQPNLHKGGERDAAPARYPWLLPRHRQWATRIIFQRDRVGILRHDLLLTFEVLKQLERRLLETEYVNWIMDERSRCRLWERRKAAEGVTDQKSSVISKDDDAVMDDENGAPQGEGEARKSTLLKRIETDRGLDVELVNERLDHASDPLDRIASQDMEEGNSLPDRNDNNGEDDDVRKRLLISALVTEDFCRGLENQVKLFMMDNKN